MPKLSFKWLMSYHLGHSKLYLVGTHQVFRSSTAIISGDKGKHDVCDKWGKENNPFSSYSKYFHKRPTMNFKLKLNISMFNQDKEDYLFTIIPRACPLKSTKYI